MGLGSEVVDLVRMQVFDHSHQGVRVAEIGDMEGDRRCVGGDEMTDAGLLYIVGGGSNRAVNLVTLVEQVLGEIGTILTGDTGDESDWHS
jgi:hypothetical protein